MSPERPPHDLPPASLDALNQLVAAERGGQGDLRLGRRTLDLLEALLKNPQEASLLGIAQLAEARGVHPSTLTRLARRLGFAGFKDFQKTFRENMAQASRFYSSKAAHLLSMHQDHSLRAPDDRAPLDDLYENELGNLVGTIRGLDASALRALARDLVVARRVYIIGLRGCYAPAHYLGYYLAFLRREVITLGGPGFTIAEDLCGVGPGDLFVAITVHPETRQSIDSARLAREHGATVATVCNHATSPVRAFGHHNFIAHSDGPFYFNPVAALFLVVEAIIAQVADSMGPEAIRLLKQREEIFEKLHIE